ncbi:MAG TPA: hypothetical protein PL033_20390 [Candidatus Brocadiia bacterium]|nr:hypothetical protein [Candidatus Brocadiia bacterium]
MAQQETPPPPTENLLIEDRSSQKWFYLRMDGEKTECNLQVPRGNYLHMLPGGFYFTMPAAPIDAANIACLNTFGNSGIGNIIFNKPSRFSSTRKRRWNAARLSPNGQMIAVPEDGSILIIETINGKMKLLQSATSAKQSIPIRLSWSPDSEMIAYYEQDTSTPQRPFCISILNVKASDGNRRRLTTMSSDGAKMGLGSDMDEQDIQWHPAGTSLIFTANLCLPNDAQPNDTFPKLYHVEIDGHNLRRLANGFLPQLNPDGFRLYYCESAESRPRVYNLKSDEDKLLHKGIQGYAIQPSPSGHFLTAPRFNFPAEKAKRIIIMDPDGKEISVIDPDVVSLGRIGWILTYW